MSTPDPYAHLRFMVSKETEDPNYRPYHVGTTPSGADCRAMPRVVLVRPGVYRCPACGKEFPTAIADLAAVMAADGVSHE